MEDEDDVWLDAFETKADGEGQEVVDIDAYDEFGNIQELVNFVAGTGTYEDTRAFEPGEEDVVEQKREMKNSNPQCPNCLDEIDEIMDTDIDEAEVDIDPYMNVQVWENESDAQYSQAEKEKTASLGIYCHDHRQETFFIYSEEWFEG